MGGFTRIVAIVVGFLVGQGCCGVGEVGLTALSSDPACEDISCPLAVDAETAMITSGVITEVVVTPTDLAALSFDPDTERLLVRPKRAGAGKLVLLDGTTMAFAQDITTAEVHATTLEPRAQNTLWDGSRREVYPEVTTQLYASTMMRVVAVLRDASGQPLLGHGLDRWTIEGGSFRPEGTRPTPELEDDRDLLDPVSFRDIVVGESGEVRVTLGDTVLVLAVRPAGSAATLALDDVPEGGEVVIDEHAELRPHVYVFDRDGRYIYGSPTELEIATGDDNVTAHQISGRRDLYLRGARSGTTSLMIRFDGHEARFRVRVR